MARAAVRGWSARARSNHILHCVVRRMPRRRARRAHWRLAHALVSHVELRRRARLLRRVRVRADRSHRLLHRGLIASLRTPDKGWRGFLRAMGKSVAAIAPTDSASFSMFSTSARPMDSGSFSLVRNGPNESLLPFSPNEKRRTRSDKRGRDPGNTLLDLAAS